MEPDPTKNIERSGFSKRRISSILKAPRKSTSCPYPEQQENVVECPKPGEKRNSRRVSFAATNDVLLFSKDVKNTSPARSPFQALPATTSGSTPNSIRGQMEATDDCSQQIAGMESLLNAPLHDYQQRDKVKFDTGENLGEKTVMFSAHDASMDMTASHTINIGNDSDLPGEVSIQGHDVLPTVRDRRVMFPDNAPGHSASLGRNQKDSLGITPTLDLDFESFLATLSKVPVPRATPPAGHLPEDRSRPFSHTHRVDVDKENQVLPSVFSATRKSLNVSRKSEEFPAALCPKDSVTEAQSACTQDSKEEADPFQWLFPSQEMYANSDRTASHAAETAKTGSLPTSVKSFAADDAEMDVTESHTANISSDFSLKFHQKPNVASTREEKTIRFSSDDAEMDVTRSQTVNIATELNLPSHRSLDVLPTCGERTVRFSADDAGMDVTESQTVNIATHMKPKEPSVEPLLPSGERTVRFSADDAGMDITTSQTVNIATQMEPKEPNVEPFLTSGERTVRFSADDAAMDVTKSHTAIITTDFNTQSHRGLDVVSMCGEKTVRFLVDDAGMDITTCQTVNIATHMEPKEPSVEPFLTSGERTVRFSADDAGMDITTSQTVNIATHMEPKEPNVEPFLTSGERTVRFSADDAGMDITTSQTVNIATHMEPKEPKVEPFLTSGERTVRFSADDAGMDVTKSHTVNIATDFSPLSPEKLLDVLPTCGERTVRFCADDAGMDVTKSHTVNIAFHTEQEEEPLPTCGEKTVRFTTDDAAMDETKSHTVDIASHFKRKSQNIGFLSTSREKTLRFSAEEAAMDATRSHTVSISTDSNTHQSVDGEKTVRFSAEDEGMDVTRSHTGNISINPEPKSLNEEFVPAFRETTSDATTDVNQAGAGNPSRNSNCFSPQRVSPIRKTMDSSCTSGKDEIESGLDGHMSEAETFGFPLPQETPDQDQSKAQNPDLNTEMGSGATETTDRLDVDANMDLTEPQTGHISEQTRPAETPPQNQAGPSHPDDVATADLPESVEANKTETGGEFEPSGSKSPSPVEAVHSRKSRRKSLADLQSKVRRLSHMISAAPEPAATPSSSEERDVPKNSEDKPESPAPERELQNNTRDLSLAISEPFPASGTTPFNLKTKQLMSRISLGDFQPKLPPRSKPDHPKKATPAAEHTRTVTVVDDDVSDICDEELGSLEEDVSETFDAGSLQKTPEKESSPKEFDSTEDDEVFEEDGVPAVVGQKRPSSEEDNLENEKRRRASETEYLGDAAESDSTMTTAPVEPSSCGHTTTIRGETTFESTYKQSLFESQLEDDASDAQTKLVDGSITVLDFFKLFNIDFVIHNPRQSVHPGGFPSDAEVTPMDALRNRHISLPKVAVYKADVQALTQKVESLKFRTADLDKPLKTFNRRLWEEMRYFSEKELKSFGVKLKERNNFFRKTSKARSHEMKEVLYSSLVQANLEEQQKLKGTIEEADEMIRNLDDCIHELQAELNALEEKGSENKPSLKSLQEEMKKDTETLAENERKISELELQTKQDASKLKRLRAESWTLESHMDMLDILSEWTCKERRDDGAVYTFLHDTMTLQLTYETSSGNEADSFQKTKRIDFTFQLDEEKSQCHARLVHSLVSRYIEGEAAWVEKYPTSGHVPKLLHDVSLVVGRCRLLGDECRRLQRWGSLPFDILDIGCADARVRIVFSSLRRFAKFEVVFAVSLTNQHFVLRVDSFRNMIGTTEIQQIEEIVASLSPENKDVLTATVKKIHDALLR